MATLKIKKGDTVKVLSGNDKGKTGEVLEIIPKNDKVIVKGVIFDFSKALLPVEFTATNPNAMNYFEGLNAGAKMIVYFSQTDAWGQVQFNDGWWANGAVSFPELGGAYLNTDNAGGKDVTKMELTLTQELLDHIKATAGDYWGTNSNYHNGDTRVAFVIQGSDWIIEKITILP